MKNKTPSLPNIVYHATQLKHLDSIRDKILIHRNNARTDLDFGKGFYTTSSYQQAYERARLLQERERLSNGSLQRDNRGIIISFELNAQLLYSIDNRECKVFPDIDKEWAEYIVSNRAGRRQYLNNNFKWTYGALADGKFIGFLCKEYINGRIRIDQLINGYIDGDLKVQGIAPHHDDYDQLSFHIDEEFVNEALMLRKFELIDHTKMKREGGWLL